MHSDWLADARPVQPAGDPQRNPDAAPPRPLYDEGAPDRDRHAGEFATIPFQTKTNGFKVRSFEATEVKLKVIDTVPSATISASAPQGVGSLDITYELRTGADA